ncbi:MAG: diacylglycerol kinase family protein [Patescibacteria group bacterium]
MVKTDKLTRSFRDAWQGLVLVFREEQNFRIHILAGVTAILVGVALGIPSVHFLILIVAISAVLSAELLNSALERFLDVIKPRVSPYVQAIKDILAAIVLICSLGSIGVGLIIFLPPLADFVNTVVLVTRF